MQDIQMWKHRIPALRRITLKTYSDTVTNYLLKNVTDLLMILRFNFSLLSDYFNTKLSQIKTRENEYQ